MSQHQIEVASSEQSLLACSALLCFSMAVLDVPLVLAGTGTAGQPRCRLAKLFVCKTPNVDVCHSLVTSKALFLSSLTGAFRLYDVDSDGYITREEMYNIVDAIYQMLGSQANSDEESPRERVDKIFEQLDKVSRFCRHE